MKDDMTDRQLASQLVIQPDGWNAGRKDGQQKIMLAF